MCVCVSLQRRVQAIAMIAYLAEQHDSVANKCMVIAPKSVLSNWVKEFEKWLPSLRVLLVGGSKEDRATQLKSVKNGDFDVVVTSFEVVCLEKGKLNKTCWHYLIIDEAHRIKNENSLLSQVVHECIKRR